MWAKAKVLNSLTSVLRSTQQKGVCASRSPESQLVQSQSLTTSLLDSGSGGSSESESSNGELGEVEKTVVIGDCADNDYGLAGRFIVLLDGGYETGEGHRRTVDAGHKKATKDNLVEV